jgi:hypothetical protein
MIGQRGQRVVELAHQSPSEALRLDRVAERLLVG